MDQRQSQSDLIGVSAFKPTDLGSRLSSSIYVTILIRFSREMEPTGYLCISKGISHVDLVHSILEAGESHSVLETQESWWCNLV